MEEHILVTGGAGFIGSHLVDHLISEGFHVVVLDKLTYAGDLNNIAQAEKTSQLDFVHGDICDMSLVLNLLRTYRVRKIFHLAAESHVDNSIRNPSAFAKTNVMGTLSVLQAAHVYWNESDQISDARFVHVSTDEVFGYLLEDEPPFVEETPYKPTSPYSASKASSDHFAHAWFSTFGLPVIVTHCSNNFGPRQHDEKLIPTIIRSALHDSPIPIYGTGRNIRDWLYVKEHCQGLFLALMKGKPGESYGFGGQNEMRNLEIAEMLCEMLDQEVPRDNKKPYKDLIHFVEDRKGHDWRYAISIDKAKDHLGFSPSQSCEKEFLETVRYYIQRYYDSNAQSLSEEDLKTSQSIDFAQVDLSYEAFRCLAQNESLSENERLGFPDSYREGFAAGILQDIAQKLELDLRSEKTLLDIGCGAGALTAGLLTLCEKKKINVVLVDSPEMLDHIDKSFLVPRVPGQFPENLEPVRQKSPEGYHAILCYSVLHYIVLDQDAFDFIDAICSLLAPGGAALIGDIPNQSKRNRFFSTEAGIAFHKNFVKTNDAPKAKPCVVKRNSIDEALLNSLIERARANGCHAYLLPQSSALPMHNRRDDLLIQKV